MIRGRRLPANNGVGVAGTVLVHGFACALLFTTATRRPPPPPVYKVQLVAAPEPVPGERKAPEAVERPAEQPTPLPKAKAPKNAASHEAPPPLTDAVPREAAPRTTSKVAPLPGERPSTGTSEVTVSTEGIDFPYPEYLQNAMTQILRRWQRPLQSSLLEAEVSFFIHRDGSITDLQFVKRSGNFAFDLEAEGAVEETGRSRAFGDLPSGWKSDVLFVRFFFAPPGQR